MGTLEVDQAHIFELVTRLDGYIEELQVTSPGEHVTKGQPLMTIYSPDLRAPEQELVSLLKVQTNSGTGQASMDQLLFLARHRLQQLNVDPNDISELERTGQPTDLLVLHSPFEGVVSEAPMKVGMSVKRGDHLMTLLNLSSMWLWATFYENEMGLLREGQSVTSYSAHPAKSVLRRENSRHQSNDRSCQTHRNGSHRYSKPGRRTTAGHVCQCRRRNRCR